MTKSNSRIVTFIASGVLIFGLVQLLEAIAIRSRSKIAIDYGANELHLMARIILAIVWASIFFWQAFQLYRHRQSSLNLRPIGAILAFFVLYRLILAWFSFSIIDQQQWVILMIVIVCTIILGWVFQRRTAEPLA